MKNSVIFIFVLLITLDFCFALTGSSSSYSVSSFSNGALTGTGSSGSYDARFLSDNHGTSSNAQSSSFRGNIGFFSQGSYSTSVSITSYSITPTSSVVGSTVAFYISALNANSVWVEITPPNSQVYTLNLINGQTVNHLPIPSIVGTYQSVFYARSSSGAIASVVGSFTLTAQSSSPTPSSNAASGGSGGGGGGSTTSCNYIWDCTPWSVCTNGLQNRVCSNIGNCVGVQGKPIEQLECSESLFDVLINLDSISVEDDSISFDVLLSELLNSDEIDVHIKYSIIDSQDNEIFSQIETRAVSDQLSYTKTIDGLSLEEGNYKLRVDVLYGNLQRAFAEESFEYNSLVNTGGITGSAVLTDTAYQRIIYSVVSLVISALLLVMMLIYSVRARKVSQTGDTLLNLSGLEVYTDSGVKIGRVYDVSIEDNKIYGLMVAVDKEAHLQYSKVMIRYQYVKNVKDVVVVSAAVLDSPSTAHA